MPLSSRPEISAAARSMSACASASTATFSCAACSPAKNSAARSASSLPASADTRARAQHALLGRLDARAALPGDEHRQFDARLLLAVGVDHGVRARRGLASGPRKSSDWESRPR